MARNEAAREVGQQCAPGRLGHSVDRSLVVQPQAGSRAARKGIVAIVANGRGGREIAGLVAEFVVQTIAAAYDDADPSEVDEFNQMIRELRNQSPAVSSNVR